LYKHVTQTGVCYWHVLSKSYVASAMKYVRVGGNSVNIAQKQTVLRNRKKLFTCPYFSHGKKNHRGTECVIETDLYLETSHMLFS